MTSRGLGREHHTRVMAPCCFRRHCRAGPANPAVLRHPMDHRDKPGGDDGGVGLESLHEVWLGRAAGRALRTGIVFRPVVIAGLVPAIQRCCDIPWTIGTSPVVKIVGAKNFQFHGAALGLDPRASSANRTGEKWPSGRARGKHGGLGRALGHACPSRLRASGAAHRIAHRIGRAPHPGLPTRHSSVALMAFSLQIVPPERFALRDSSKPYRNMTCHRTDVIFYS